MTDCSAKSWAKNRQSRKYSSRRKANPNGADLRRVMGSFNNEGRASIESEGAINPIEQYLGIRSPNSTDIATNLKAIIQHTNPTEIRFEKAGDKEPGPYSRGSSRSSERFDRWILFYRYSAEQLNEQYLDTARQQKKWQKLQQNFQSAAKKRPSKVKQYRPPIIREKPLVFKTPCDHSGWRCPHNDEAHLSCLQIDLERNQWLTAFSTAFHYDCHGQWGHGTIRKGIGAYKLFVAVDEEDRDRRLRCADVERGVKPKRDRVRRRTKTSWKKAQRQGKADFDGERAKKWECVGTFNGSLVRGAHPPSWRSSSPFYDPSKNYFTDVVHRVAHRAHVDYDNDESLKRSYAKNGKLCRWIKVQPLERDYDLTMLSCNAYGVAVNEWSQPIVPYNGRTIAGDDGELSVGDIDGEEEDQFKPSSHGFRIGPRIEEDEIREGKGCRLVLSQKRKRMTFGRRLDGSLGGWRMGRNKSDDKWRSQTAAWCARMSRRGRVDDFDRNGILRS